MLWFKKPSFAAASKGRRIYLDYASAPPVLAAASAAVRDAERLLGNPGAIHKEAVEAKHSLESSRERIALHIGCKAREILFTSGLTESNNLAIVGHAHAVLRSGKNLQDTHWVVSAIEHDSILECFGEVERLGGKVSFIQPDSRGIIQPETVVRAIRPETVFVSVGWANNEIGTIQPLREIARELRTHEKAHSSRIIFHSDAGQAPLYLPTVVQSLGVDFLSIGSSKLYGPHGIGALIVRNRVSLSSPLFGGKQERGLRPGTENVALAAGFAEAFATVVGEREEEAKRVRALRDQLAKELTGKIAALVVNGDLREALPHMLNVSIPNISSEYLTLALDNAGIAVSTKSACREGEESRSHVVEALGDADSMSKEERAAHTIRISLGRDTTSSDISTIVETFAKLLK